MIEGDLGVLCTTSLALVGAGVIIKFTLRFVSAFYCYFLRSGRNLKRYGDWAVVTGATDGIGKALCFEFAKKGLNVVLISRTQSKLDETSTEIKKKYPSIQTLSLAVDFKDFGPSEQLKVKAALGPLDIGILVNNVGMSYPYPTYFLECSNETVQSILNINVVATTWMTYLILPSMEQKKKGAIINISSGSGQFPCPLLSLYSGTKAFVDRFTEGLAAEYSKKGIHISSQAPLFVATKMAKMRPSLTVPSPTQYARSSVARIGYETLTSPFWFHGFQLWVISCLPSGLVSWYIGRLHGSLRKRGQKKDQEKTK